MAQAHLFDIHAAPGNAALKLAYAEWRFGQWGELRGELIRAQEAFRASG